MSAFDDRMRGLTARLLSRFGGDATLSAASRAYDPLTGSVIASETITMSRATLSTRTLVSQDGRLTTQTIATLQDEPKIGDGLKIGATRYTVASVEVVAPSGDAPVLYRAVLKR